VVLKPATCFHVDVILAAEQIQYFVYVLITY